MPMVFRLVGETSPLIKLSGEADPARLDPSMDQRMDALVGTEGVETMPRASVTVLTWLSSLLALLSIVALASEDENRGGR